jgi:hypothetical protein
MKLHVVNISINQVANYSIFKLGQNVSLYNNVKGSNVCVHCLESKIKMEIISPHIQFNMEDEDTEINIQGFIRAQNGVNYDSVRLMLA